MERAGVNDGVAAQQRLHGYLDALRHSIDRHSIDSAQPRAAKQRAGGRSWKLAGGALGVGMLARLFGGGSHHEDDVRLVSRRALDDGFVDTLAGAVQRRMRGGAALRDALAQTLRERAPVLLQPAPRRGRPVAGLVRGLGIAALAGAGVYLAARRLLGQNPVEAIRQRLQGEHDETSAIPGERYSAVHGTAGAVMPVPEASGAPYTGSDI